MRGLCKLVPLALFLGLTAASCGTTTEQKSATGAIAGAVVGGPVGAAVGGAAGAAVQGAVDRDRRN